MRRAASEEEKALRRGQLLDAAKTVFAEKGYHDTTVADVARAAGLSYGSVYWYFDSKEALFRALMSECEAALRLSVEVALSTTPTRDDPVAPFRAAVRAAFEFFEGDRDLVRLLFGDSRAMGRGIESHLAGIYQGFVSDIEEVVVQAQRGRHVVDAPPRLVAFSIAALIGQLALRRTVTTDGVTAAQVADFVVSLLLNGLRPRQEPAISG